MIVENPFVRGAPAPPLPDTREGPAEPLPREDEMDKVICGSTHNGGLEPPPTSCKRTYRFRGV